MFYLGDPALGVGVAHHIHIVATRGQFPRPGVRTEIDLEAAVIANEQYFQRRIGQCKGSVRFPMNFRTTHARKQ
jgi:hypothetical protein